MPIGPQDALRGVAEAERPARDHRRVRHELPDGRGLRLSARGSTAPESSGRVKILEREARSASRDIAFRAHGGAAADLMPGPATASSPRSRASCSRTARTSSPPISTPATRTAGPSLCGWCSAPRVPIGGRSGGAFARQVADRFGLDWRFRLRSRAQARGDPRLAPGPLPDGPAVALAEGELAAEIRAGGLQPSRSSGGPRLRDPLSTPAGRRRATKPAAEAACWRCCGARSTSSCWPATCRSSAAIPRTPRRAGHQHPPLVPAGLRRRGPVPARARERGVKIIGATAHYVTADSTPGRHPAGRGARQPP